MLDLHSLHHLNQQKNRLDPEYPDHYPLRNPSSGSSSAGQLRSPGRQGDEKVEWSYLHSLPHAHAMYMQHQLGKGLGSSRRMVRDPGGVRRAVVENATGSRVTLVARCAAAVDVFGKL